MAESTPALKVEDLHKSFGKIKVCLVAFLFLIITGVSDLGMRWLDKRYSVGVLRI